MTCNFWVLVNSMLKSTLAIEPLTKFNTKLTIGFFKWQWYLQTRQNLLQMSQCVLEQGGSIFVLRCMSGFICCTRLFSCTPKMVFITFTGEPGWRQSLLRQGSENSMSVLLLNPAKYPQSISYNLLDFLLQDVFSHSFYVHVHVHFHGRK